MIYIYIYIYTHISIDFSAAPKGVVCLRPIAPAQQSFNERYGVQRYRGTHAINYMN